MRTAHRSDGPRPPPPPPPTTGEFYDRFMACNSTYIA